MEKSVIDDMFILQQVRKGDETAFKHLFETYFTPLCRFARLYLKVDRIPEEIVLDVFTVIWEKRESVQIAINVKAYLFQATKNRAYNYLRDNNKYIATSDFSSLEEFEHDFSFESRELQRLIEEAVCSLPRKCQEIFRKSRMEDLTNKEIAVQMNISVKTVEAHIGKALKYIRTYLGDSYYYFW